MSVLRENVMCLQTPKLEDDLYMCSERFPYMQEDPKGVKCFKGKVEKNYNAKTDQEVQEAYWDINERLANMHDRKLYHWYIYKVRHMGYFCYNLEVDWYSEVAKLINSVRYFCIDPNNGKNIYVEGKDLEARVEEYMRTSDKQANIYACDGVGVLAQGHPFGDIKRKGELFPTRPSQIPKGYTYMHSYDEYTGSIWFEMKYD